MPLESQLARFDAYLINERRAAPLTVQNYRRDLERLREFCERRRVDE